MADSRAASTSPLLDLVFDDDVVGRCLVAPDGTVLRTNREWRRSTGFSTAELLGADIIELFPTTRDMALAMHARARAGHRVEVPRHMQRIRGIETWWEGRIEPVPMEGGTGLLITTRELDAPGGRARLTQAVAELADFLREVGPAAMVLFEPAPPFRVLFANQAYQQLWPEPLRTRGLVGLELTGFIPDAEEAGVAEVFRAVARTRVTRHVDEFRYALSDGEHWFNWTLAPVVRGGELVALANVAVDVTREVRARMDAERARDEIRREAELLELGDALCELDSDYRVVRVNARQEELTGIPRSRSLGKTHWELWPDTARPDSPWWLEYHRCMEQRVPVQFENYYAPLRLWSNVTVYPTSAGGIAIFFRDVTPRRRAEEARRESETRFRTVFEQAAVGIGRVSFSDARWVDVNDTFCKMLGRSREEMLRTSWPEITHPEDLALELVPFRRMAAGDLESCTVEKRFIHTDGHHVWARLTLSAVRDADARPDYEIAIIEDITPRKRTEAALEAERMRWRGVVEGIAEEVWVCDAHGRMSLINLPDKTTMGLEEFHGKTYAEVIELVEILTVEGKVRPAQDAPLLRSLRTGEVLRGEEIMRHREGRLERHRQYSCAPTRDPSGAITGAVAIVRDVTAHRRAEEALRTSEAGFRALIEELHSGVALIDASGRFSLFNKRFLGLFGLRPDADIKNVNDQEWSAWKVFDPTGRLLPVDEHPVRRAVLRRESVRDVLVGVRLPSGGPLRWMLVSAEPLRADDGGIKHVICTYHDITAQKHAEEELRRSEATLEAFFAGSPGILNIADEEFRYVMTDPITPTYFGLTRETVVGKAVGDLAPQFIERFGPMMRRVIETGEPALNQDVFSPVPGRPGEVASWLASYFPVPLPGGRRGIGIMGVEITDRKNAEAALRAANQKLVEADRRKDEFLGMLSHELRNPLAPIRNSIYLMRHAELGTERAARAQAVMERQAEHLTRLVDDLLDVTRIARGKIDLRRSRVDLREVVSRAADDFRVLMQERAVVFEVVLPDAELWADADPTRVTQIIGNLLHNASKFTRRGDRVTLTLAPRDGTGVITVRDTGAGITPSLLPSVFEPFVQGDRTLARTEGGLGLGLALVKAIAELHGGSVRADSSGEGKGAEFAVEIPLTSERPA